MGGGVSTVRETRVLGGEDIWKEGKGCERELGLWEGELGLWEGQLGLLGVQVWEGK